MKMTRTMTTITNKPDMAQPMARAISPIGYVYALCFHCLSLVLFTFLLFSSLATSSLAGQTVAEKLAGNQQRSDLPAELQKELTLVNKEIAYWHAELRRLFAKAEQLYLQNGPEEEFRHLLQQIAEVRDKVARREEQWRRQMVREGYSESYALWHQPNTTIGDLILDYGAQDYVYLVPPELGAVKLSIDSNLVIPRSSWPELLDRLLLENGIGIKQLTPFLRELYSLSDDHSSIRMITKRYADLNLLPPQARVAFVLNPDPLEAKRIWYFLNKFANLNSTFLQQIGREIILIATVAEVRELLKLYNFVLTNRIDRRYQILPLKRANPQEMADVLVTLFRSLSGPFPREDEEQTPLQVIALQNVAPALVLVGSREEILRATKVVHEIEKQIAGSKEKVVFVYEVLHSDGEELAVLLDKLYPLMLMSTGPVLDPYSPPITQNLNNVDNSAPNSPAAALAAQQQQLTQTAPPNSSENANRNVVQFSLTAPQPPPPPLSQQQLYQDGFYQEGAVVVDTTPIQPLQPAFPRSIEPDRNNFLVYKKTNTILMVVEADVLPKIKQLLSKIDRPKKMVQIDVMLFEKRIGRRDNGGLSLLRIGDRASQTNDTGATFNVDPIGGLFNFFLSRTKSGNGVPAFDFVYQFLISQRDVHINSTPSVVTVNQTPALIAIQDEISISTGIFDVETVKGVTLKDSYTRAQYGITIKVTPTIHMQPEFPFFQGKPEKSYVSLESEITFDTIVPGPSAAVQRPDVIRRKVSNEARVPDGQSVIIGGLRRKEAALLNDAIPFLGELPGVGLFFSQSSLRDEATEMFIFITPHIIDDPEEDFYRLRMETLCRRPGDVPEFLRCIECANRAERLRLLEGTLNVLFGPEEPCFYVPPSEEYDGCL